MRHGKSKKNRITDFDDRCVIYHSTSDKCWIAHSLNTDQIGTGEQPLDALVELLEAIGHLLDFARKHKNVKVRRYAPRAVRKRAEKAILLPDELCGIAQKRVLREWPNEIKLVAEPVRNRALAARITEVAFPCKN